MASALPTSLVNSGAEAVIAFIQSLHQARPAGGHVSTPAPISQVIQKSIFRQGSEVGISIVEELVAVLELYGSTLCERLNGHAIILVCGLLRLSTPCLAQERGLFIIADCLHEDPQQDPSYTLNYAHHSILVAKKDALGRIMVPWALRRFLEAARPEELRKALGAFSVELLNNSIANQELLLEPAQAGICLHLGTCALQDNSELVKLIAGSIIREMLFYARCSPEQFWPNGEESQGVKPFPESRTHTSQWVYDFASFAERHPLRSSRAHAQENVIFATAMLLDKKLYSIKDASAVVVVVSRQLSMALLSPTTDPSLYLSIPYDKIQGIEHGEVLSQARSQTSTNEESGRYRLSLHMKVSDNSNHYINAKGGSVNTVTLLFDHCKDSQLVEHEILEHCPQIANESHTTSLDVSSEHIIRTPQDASDMRTLPALASDAMTALDTVNQANDPSAPASSEGSINDPRAPKMQPHDLPGEQPPTSGYGNTADVRTSAPGLVKNPPASLLSRTRNSIDASSSAIRYNAPLRVGDLESTEERTITPSLQGLKLTAVGEGHRGLYSTDENQVPHEDPNHDTYSIWDPLYDVSPKHPNASKARQQDAELAVGDKAKKKASPLKTLKKIGNLFSSAERRKKDQAPRSESPETRAAAEIAEGLAPSNVSAAKPQRKKLSQRMRDSEGRAAAETVEEQISSNAKVAEPRKPKLSQQLRDAEGRTAADSASMAPEKTRGSLRGGALRRAIDATETGSAISKKKGANIRSERGGVATKSSKATNRDPRKTNMVAEPTDRTQGLQKSGVAHASQMTSKMNTSRGSKTTLNKGPSKAISTVNQSSKAPAKRSQLPKPIQRANRDDVNYDEAFEVDDEDDDEYHGQGASSKGSKRRRGQKTAIGKKVAKKAPAKSSKPKAKTPSAPVVAQKSRRGAAVKATQAIQSIAEDPIVDDGTEERPVIEHHTIAPKPLEAKSPLAAPLPKASSDSKPVSEKLLLLPPVKALSASKLPVVNSSLTFQGPETSNEGRHQNPGPPALKTAALDILVDDQQNAPLAERNILYERTIPPTLPPNGFELDLPEDPTQDHFDDAMMFTETHNGKVLSDPMEAPTPQQEIPAADVETEAQRVITTNSEMKRDEETINMPEPSKKSLSASKLQSALSVIPQLHPDQTQQHPVREFRVSAAKANSSAMKTKMPEAKTAAAPEATAKPQAGQKRERGKEETMQAKRSRLLDPDHAPQEGKSRGCEINGPSPNKSTLDFHRKPNIVHFEPTGPANQGSSARKPKTTSPTHNDGQEDSSLGINHKRKLVNDEHDEPEVPYQQTEKRPKLDRHDRKAQVPKDITPLPNLLIRTHDAEQARKTSSQSSRVDAFGSPQPYRHSRATSLATSKLQPRGTPQLFIADDDLGQDENLPPDQDEISGIPQPHLPTGKRNETSLRSEPVTMIIPDKRKHRPSSPSATSCMVDDFTAHKEQAGGHFIDVRTAEIVAPEKPQDPFSVAAGEPQNDFMDLLRQSISRNADSSRPGKSTGQKLTTQGNSDGSDLEKTLIGGWRSDEDASSTTSESSSDSRNSSSPDDDSSDDGDGSTREGWRRALRRHQSATFEVLLEIAHCVTQDLVSKEEAVRNLIEDYRKGGSRLIDEYEKARKQEHMAHKAIRDQEKATLFGVFQNVKEELTQRTDRIEGQTSEYKADWEKRQLKVSSGIEELLATTAE